MKTKTILLAALALAAAAAFGQTPRASAYFEYATALGMREGVTEATAFGGGVRASFPVGGGFSIAVTSGYKQYALEQDDELEKWNWRFWEARYGSKIEADLAADPALAVELEPTQGMKVVPLLLSAEYRWAPTESLRVTPALGGGVLFVTRTLYVEERWSKTFKQVDYVFDYELRNFAPDKGGNPLAAVGSATVEYLLAEGLEVAFGAGYAYVIPTEGELGYDNYPLDDELSASFALTVRY